MVPLAWLLLVLASFPLLTCGSLVLYFHLQDRRTDRKIKTAGDESLAASERITPPARRMTEAEREAQRRSFAYGNAKLSNPNVTRQMIDNAANSYNDRPPDDAA